MTSNLASIRMFVEESSKNTNFRDIWQMNAGKNADMHVFLTPS